VQRIQENKSGSKVLTQFSSTKPQTQKKKKKKKKEKKKTPQINPKKPQKKKKKKKKKQGLQSSHCGLAIYIKKYP